MKTRIRHRHYVPLIYAAYNKCGKIEIASFIQGSVYSESDINTKNKVFHGTIETHVELQNHRTREPQNYRTLELMNHRTNEP